jgi:hypothetical protein
VTAVLLAFLAAYRPTPARAAGFAGATLAATAVHAATTLVLLARVDAAPTGLTRFRFALLALAVLTATAAAMLRDRRALHGFLLQLAHRAVALALWLLIAKLVIAAWGRPMPAATHLLPAAVALLAAAFLSATTVLLTSRRGSDRATLDESGRLTRVAAFLLAAAILWLTWAAFFP